MGEWVEALLAHAGELGLLTLRALLRCGRVSRRWREAVRCALPTLRALDFRGSEARVTGPDVLAVMGRVAGANLATVDLARCRRLGAADVEQILACVPATCPGEIVVTGCRSRAILRAVAVRARDALAAASPLDLFVLLEALHRAGEEDEEESAGGRCWFGRVCAHLRTLPAQPRLVLDPEFDPEENAGDSDWEAAEDAQDSDSEAEEDTPGYLDRLLVKEASEGSGWSAALLLGVSFGEDDDVNARMCGCDARDRSGSHVLHVAAERGDADMVSLLLRARADVEVEDKRGNTPLLLACRAGHLELAQMLLGNDADASAANKQGDTPLLAAVAAGNAQLAMKLKARGANVEASRRDGANVLVLALLSKSEACIRLALTQGPARLQGQDTLDVRAFVQRLAEAFFDPAQIGAWIRRGAAPSALMAEIGALLSSADVGAAVKEQLEHVLAFLNHHEHLLGDRGRWPVPRAEQLVAQLASQEPHATFACVESGALDAASKQVLIKCINKLQTRRRCRRTYKAEEPVSAVAVSPDGSRLAYVAGRKVVVHNCPTGLAVSQLSCDSAVPSIDWHDQRITAGCSDGTIKVFDAQSGDCLSTVRCDSDVLSVAYSADGTKLAAGLGYPEPSVVVFNTQTNEQICSLRGHTDLVKSVCFSPCGEKIASGGGDVFGNRDYSIRIWDAKTGEQIGSPLNVGNDVTSVEFADQNTLVSADSSGKTKVWNIATAEEKTEALAGSKFALSKGKGNRKQQVGRFVCTAEGDLLLIHLLSDVEEGGDKAAKTTRAPVAFFRAPSPIQALDCQGAEIALGCQSGAVLLLRAAVLLT